MTIKRFIYVTIRTSTLAVSATSEYVTEFMNSAQSATETNDIETKTLINLRAKLDLTDHYSATTYIRILAYIIY